MMNDDAWTIVKVGGSLFDLPDLRERLSAWLGFDTSPQRKQGNSLLALRARGAGRILLVPGGGGTANAIRSLDRVHQLGEEASHWLAIQALSLNARFLQTLLPTARLVPTLACASGSEIGILDPFPFFQADEERSDHLPHLWQVTSDSLAVRVAALAAARELVLLKSADWSGSDWKGAEIVDGYFAVAVRGAPSLRIRIVNFRA